METHYLIIIFSILASGFFSGMEIAFLTANKLRIEMESNQGFIPARLLSFFISRPQRFIGTTLVGNNITLVVYGFYMAELLEPLFMRYISSQFLVLVFSVLTSTFLVVITAEFTPKALFRINPNAILNALAIPFALCYVLLFPLVLLTVGLAENILKYAFRLDFDEHRLAFGRVDLDNYVKQFSAGNQQHVNFNHEIKIFQKALDFSAVKVRDCMIPRPEIIALEVNEPIKNLHQKFVETHLSKIIIYEENIDHIIGYVHSSEMFKKPTTIREILLPVLLVPETMQAGEILQQLKQQRKSIAIVVDEFGGTSGLLTIEDVMEEIFGEIEDEHDKEEFTERKLSDIEYELSGRLEIPYLNEKYALNIPESAEYNTLAGFILHHAGSIPQKNEEIEVPGFLFTIISISGNKIDTVQLKLLE